MRKCANILPYTRRPLVIHDFATDPFWISLYLRKILLSFFISAAPSLCGCCCLALARCASAFGSCWRPLSCTSLRLCVWCNGPQKIQWHFCARVGRRVHRVRDPGRTRHTDKKENKIFLISFCRKGKKILSLSCTVKYFPGRLYIESICTDAV